MVKKSIKRILSALVASTIVVSSTTFARETKYNKSVELNELIEQLKNISVDEKSTQLLMEENHEKGEILLDIDLYTSDMVNIIVEFKEEPLGLKNQGARGFSYESIEREHSEFQTFLNGLYPESQELSNNMGVQDIVVGNEYKHAFNGISLSIRGNRIEELLNSPHVKRIWKDSEVRLDQPQIDKELYGDYLNDILNGNITNSNKVSLDSANEIEPYMHDTIPYLGIDKLHNEGITGKGIKVAVLDTGIDYNHPDLKNVYKGGYDFIDMDNDPMEATYEEWKAKNKENPNLYPESMGSGTYYTSHGTHVSGTVAGQSENKVPLAVKGVAPDVELSVYRVLGPYGFGSNSSILGGIDRAVKDNMDIMNLSLGSSVNDPMSPLSVAINNAAKAGVVPLVAAGNSGVNQNGNIMMYSTGSPGVAPLCISVGAATADMTVDTIGINQGSNTFEGRMLARNFNTDLNNLKDKSYELVYVGKGTAEDVANVDLTGKIALIERGDLSLYEKILNACNKGAEGVLLYNNVEGNIDLYLGEFTNLEVGFAITKEAGMALREAIDNGNNTMSFGETGSFKIEGGQLADFSSRGPVINTFDIKPDIVGTGVSVFSTYPEFINDKDPNNDRYDIAYSRISGTSMATPHLAGIAALILQAHPEYTVEQVKAVIMNTANPLKGDYSVYEEGAGMVDPYEAVHTDNWITITDTVKNFENGEVTEINHKTGSSRFGSMFVGEENPIGKEFNITNNSANKKTYEISYEFNYGSLGSEIIGVKDGRANNIEINLPKTLEVDGKATKSINVNPIIPNVAEEGLYEGYIYFKNEESSIRVPFTLKYVQKGVEFEIGMHAFSNKNYTPGMPKAIGGMFKINNPMKYIDFILVDGETNQAVGYCKRYDATNLPLGIGITDRILDRGVLKLTGDNKNPVSTERFVPDDGYYKIACVSIDKNGETYIKMEDMLIANVMPEFTLDKESGLYEVGDDDYTVEEYNGRDYEAYWIKGKLTTEVINQLRALGNTDLTQKDNMVQLIANGRPSIVAKLDDEGNFKIGVQKEDIENFGGSVSVEFLVSAYGMMAYLPKNNITLIQEGAAYNTVVYEKKDVIQPTDKVKAQVWGNNYEGVKKTNFLLSYTPNSKEITDVAISQEIKDYAEANNGEIKVNLNTGFGLIQMDLSIVSKDDPNVFIPINGTMPILDFNQVTNSNMQSAFLTMCRNDLMDGTSKSFSAYVINKPVVLEENKGYKINLDVRIQGPGFENRKEFIVPGKQIKLSLTTKEGINIAGVFNRNIGMYVFDGVTTQEKMKLKIEVPGHLTYIGEINPVELNDKGEQEYDVYPEMAKVLSGDINGDQVVDLEDIMMVKAKIGTRDKNLVEDLTGDGYIDSIDLAYVVKNYGKKGALATKEPITEIDGVTIDQILTSVEKSGIYVGANTQSKKFKAGQNILVEFNLEDIFYNFAYDPYGVFEVPILVAQYDENNKLISFTEVNTASQFAIINKNFNIKSELNAKKIKIFMWNSINGMRVMKEHCILEAE